MVISSPKSDSGIVRETHPNPTKDDDNQINQDVSNKDEPNHNHNNNNNNNSNNNHVLKNLFSPRRSPSRFSIMKSPSQVSLGNQSRMSSIAELEDDSMHSLKMVHQTPPNERGILFKQSFSVRLYNFVIEKQNAFYITYMCFIVSFQILYFYHLL